MDKKQKTRLLKDLAKGYGFSGVTIAKAEHMDEEARRLEQWLNMGYHGEMTHLETTFDKRVDPTKVLNGAKSVVSMMYNYYTPEKQKDPEAPKIATYAYGRDYHKVIKKKLKKLANEFKYHIGDFEYKGFVDSAPILERDWAKRSGLGWIGKNTLLLNKEKGSYFFLADFIIDVEFEYDGPTKDHCGSCTKCIDACPTDAISPKGYVLDGSRCISYLTIEKRGDIPEEFRGKMDGWMFGCDICQLVCPWNRFSTPHNQDDFLPKHNLLDMTKKDWQELTMETYDTIFFGSAVKRAKYEDLVRNIKFLEG